MGSPATASDEHVLVLAYILSICSAPVSGSIVLRSLKTPTLSASHPVNPYYANMERFHNYLCRLSVCINSSWVLI